jgi:nitrate reductase NapE component
MTSSKFFAFLVGLSAFCIAGSAAFFSVFGLSKLFAGATNEVIIMAGSLEFGKLIAASFLYRYWRKLNKAMRIYMTIGVVTLVLITSAGIFGFLSNAYQGATIEFEKQSASLMYEEDRLDQLEEDKVYLKDELRQAIGILAIYLARAFGTDIDTVVKFFIFLLIFVFDPMAVALVISYNIMVMEKQEGYTPSIKRSGRKWWKIYGEKKPIKEKIKEAILKKEDKTVAAETIVTLTGGKADGRRVSTIIKDE